MSQFKSASFIALAHVSKLLVHLYIMKQIALIHGPQGLGFLGNFISLIALSSALAGGGIISGIIKYTAEYSKEPERQAVFWGSALIYTLLCSLLVISLGMVFVQSLTDYIFLSSDFKVYIYFFLATQIIIALNNFAFGVCNGLKKTHVYSVLVLLGNGIALTISAYIIPRYGFWGGIVAIASPAVVSFFPILVYGLIKKSDWRLKVQWGYLLKDSKGLSHFSIMLLCSSLCFPLVEMTLRNLIVERLNMAASGYWQATMRLSMAYLSFFSLFLSFYFVPVVAEIKDKKKLLLEVRNMVLFILMLFLPMMAICYILKNQLISLVFAPDFLPMGQWLLIQMIGDFFRVLGWIVGFIIVAKACTKLYVLGELFQGGVFIVLSFIELNLGKGIEGVVTASMMTGILYCVVSFLGLFLFVFKSRITTFVSGKIIEGQSS